MKINVVELAADDDEHKAAPCRWGHIIIGHACYCHKEDWKEGPRKCPVCPDGDWCRGNGVCYWDCQDGGEMK